MLVGRGAAKLSRKNLQEVCVRVGGQCTRSEKLNADNNVTQRAQMQRVRPIRAQLRAGDVLPVIHSARAIGETNGVTTHCPEGKPEGDFRVQSSSVVFRKRAICTMLQHVGAKPFSAVISHSVTVLHRSRWSTTTTRWAAGV